MADEPNNTPGKDEYPLSSLIGYGVAVIIIAVFAAGFISLLGHH